MDVRKSAVDLTPLERDQLLEAFIRLKHRPAAGGDDLSTYDQFVALHGAVYAVGVPDRANGRTVNVAYWNVGFAPWHRQFLRVFERVLQQEVPGVTLPYWDWADHVNAVTRLFTPEFLGSLRIGSPAPLADSVFRSPVPATQRPGWWPTSANGFPVHTKLDEGLGGALTRGSVGVAWPPTSSSIEGLTRLVIQQPGTHPFWYFWLGLEQGLPQAPITHNAACNFVGGHMSGGFSPNDPVFWLHHANVDRLWDLWQARRLADVPGSVPSTHWPPPEEPSPFDGVVAPPGHRLTDHMWPWVDASADYGLDPALRRLLPDFSWAPAVSVEDVLDTRTIDAEGYRYEQPGTN